MAASLAEQLDTRVEATNVGTKTLKCDRCGEVQPVGRDGKVPTHLTSANRRCQAPPKKRKGATPRRKSAKKANPELIAAQEYVAGWKHGELDPEDRKPADRRIYGTRGASVVPGGLPGLGRRR